MYKHLNSYTARGARHAEYLKPASTLLHVLSLIILMALTHPALAQITVSTLAGGTQGSVDGPGTAAQFNTPAGLAVDAAGNVYVADGTVLVRQITPTGVVTTLAGGGTPGFADGVGTAARFNFIADVAVDPINGNIYVVDQLNQRIRQITVPGGVVTTVAGDGTQGGNDGFPATNGSFNHPFGVAADGNGSVYIADTNNHLIRSFLVDAGLVTWAGDGTQGSVDGPHTTAQFSNPFGVAVDASGNVYVADTDNHRIRKINSMGTVVSTLAGGSRGFADGNGTAAQFDRPFDVAVDASGNVYVADTNNHRIRKITPGGVVSTLAGGTQGFADGDGTAARFDGPFGVAVDASGNVYVSDPGNHRIRKITVPAPTPAGATLTINTVFVGPGANTDAQTDPAPKADITLTNTSGKAISGIQYSVDLSLPNDAIVTLDKDDTDGIADLFDDSMLPNGFDARAIVENNVLKVVIFTLNNNSIPSDGNTVNLGKICYTVPALDEGTQAPAAELLGQAKALNLINDSFLLLSDDQGVKVDNVILENGEIQVGIKGDLTGSPTTGDPIPDGAVDVRDVVVLINEILPEPSAVPTHGTVGFNIRNAATGDDPEEVNVTDAVAIVNIILGINQPQFKAIASAPLAVSLGALTTLPDGRSAVPVIIDGQGVAGLQASLDFDASLIRVGTPVLDAPAADVILDSRVENGSLRLIALSLNGRALPAGQVVLIPVTRIGDGEAALTLNDLIASNRYAQTVEVQFGATVQTVSGKFAAPKAFSLQTASPNPFNPATTIAYEVPQPAHVTLTVYNLLGQEVIRLVDQVQQAGRYQIVWNAVNGRGAQVSSGVYLYRLTSSTGYTDSKRMTLLK